MSDERVRAAERRWKDEGTDGAADAYLRELTRVGAPEEDQRAVRGRWGISATGYTTEEILAQLDEHAADFEFPMLDNGYVYLADVRLTAYRDLARWALLFEVVGTNNRELGPAGFETSRYRYGNCFTGTGFQTPLWLIEDGPSGPLERGEDDPEGELVSDTASDLSLRGEVSPLPRDPVHYAARGIALESPPHIRWHELLRALLPDHRRALLATEAELHETLGTDDLPRFLRLDAWRHPDLADDEKPSDTEAFQQIASALVRGDQSLYAPSEPPNTHWSGWPEGGAC